MKNGSGLQCGYLSVCIFWTGRLSRRQRGGRRVRGTDCNGRCIFCMFAVLFVFSNLFGSLVCIHMVGWLGFWIPGLIHVPHGLASPHSIALSLSSLELLFGNDPCVLYKGQVMSTSADPFYTSAGMNNIKEQNVHESSIDRTLTQENECSRR